MKQEPIRPVLTLKSLEAFTKAADGRATKIIIPSEIQGLAGLATSLKEFVTDDKKRASGENSSGSGMI